MDTPEIRQAEQEPSKPSPAVVAAHLATAQLIKELSVGMGMPFGPPQEQPAGK